MSEDTMALAQKGFGAWQRGDFDTLEDLLDPAVEWHWFEAGDWDCHNRNDVMRTLRERHEQGFSRGELEFVAGGEHSVVVVAHPRAIGGDEWPEEAATVITFRAGKVIRMQDYRTKDEALSAVG